MNSLELLIQFQIWNDKNKNVLYGNGFEDELEFRAKAFLKSFNNVFQETSHARSNNYNKIQDSFSCICLFTKCNNKSNCILKKLNL